MMEFRVLGPVEAVADGQPLGIGHARQRSVLAVLLLDVGHVVPAERLIDRVWGEDPPASVRNVLYGYVARLRSVLAAAGDPGVTLSRRLGGYLLQADPEQLDLRRFHRLTAEAATAGDDAAAVLLRSALGLWHGQALAGLDSPWLRGMREALEQQRIAAVLDSGDIALRLGRHGELISVLIEEAAAYPADERMAGQLMLALYRSGRQADALRRFEQIRTRLADEFGTDPGAELRALYQRILTADVSLTLAAPVPRGAPVPRELPADVPAFTGRAAEQAELDRLLAVPGGGAAGRPVAVVISAISGTAGVGKTTLAVHWAHQVARHFPDGQLYVNLRGYDPGQPVRGADALAGFLRSLGVPGQDIPPEADQRAARYRSLLAGQRMLIVLDNAGSAEQVRPLLPGTPSCTVVVTSRDTLAGLTARDGAARLDLDVLPLRDAVALLRALIGPRVDDDPAAAAVLAGQCSRLPLPLRIAAERVGARPGVPLTGLVADLADQRQRLDMLEVSGDPRAAVRAVFSWSYLHLDPDAARTFRLLALHPGPSFDAYAAAALTESALARARGALDTLTRAHLIQPAGTGRHGMHDLLLAYARELAAAHDSEEERRAALTRLLDYYLHCAATAMDAAFPSERNERPRIAAPASPVPPVTSPAAARAWLDAERSNLVAASDQAASDGWPGHATRFAATVWRFLENGGYYPEIIAIQTCARRAARGLGDLVAEAGALRSLGIADWEQHRQEQAIARFQEALALFRKTEDRAGEARSLNYLAIAHTVRHDYRQATDYARQSLALSQAEGDLAGQALAFLNLGDVERRQGHYQQADGYYQDSLTLHRRIEDARGVAHVLIRLATASLRQGRCHQASSRFQQSLDIFHEIGARSGEADAIGGLGDVSLMQGHHQQAADYQRRSLALCREIGDKSGEAAALNGIGEISLATGQPADARAQHTAALDLATQIGNENLQARAHAGLARVCDAANDRGHARHHWQEALTRYAAIGAPEADQIRAQLAGT